MQILDRRSDHFSAGVCVGTPSCRQVKMKKETKEIILFIYTKTALYDRVHEVLTMSIFIYLLNYIYRAQLTSNVVGALVRKTGSIWFYLN